MKASNRCWLRRRSSCIFLSVVTSMLTTPRTGSWPSASSIGKRTLSQYSSSSSDTGLVWRNSFAQLLSRTDLSFASAARARSSSARSCAVMPISSRLLRFQCSANLRLTYTYRPSRSLIKAEPGRFSMNASNRRCCRNRARRRSSIDSPPLSDWGLGSTTRFYPISGIMPIRCLTSPATCGSMGTVAGCPPSGGHKTGKAVKIGRGRAAVTGDDRRKGHCPTGREGAAEERPGSQKTCLRPR